MDSSLSLPSDIDSSLSLPSDIIFELLSRISSLGNLDYWRIACKDWNQIVYEPTFMSQYCRNTQNLYGYYMQNQILGRYKQKFICLGKFDEDRTRIKIKIKQRYLDSVKIEEADSVKIEASTKQGILCVVVWKPRSYRYYIGKPSTAQWQSLPNPKLRFRTLKVALVVLHSNPLRFKIVRVSQDYPTKSTCYSYCCEIFDSNSWAWRRVDDILLPYGVFFDQRNQSVHVGGLIYWLTSDDHVVAFNHEDEIYVRFALPPLENNSSHQIIEYEGKLGLVCKTGENIELWLKGNRQSHGWSLIKQVKIDSSLDYSIPEGFYNKNIALLKAIHKMVFYKLQGSGVKEIGLGTGSRFNEHIFPFRSDLEPFNLRSD